MIHFVILFLFAFLGFNLCHSVESDKELKPLDPAKPIWQVQDGYPSIPITWPIPGGLVKRRLPDPLTIDEFRDQLQRQEMTHKQEIKERERELLIAQSEREMRFGGWLKMAGWIILIFAAVAHCATNVSVIKNYSTVVFFCGAGGIASGMCIQKNVQFDKVFTVAFWVVVLGMAMIALRRKSISHLPGISHAINKVKRKMHEYKIEDEAKNV